MEVGEVTNKAPALDSHDGAQLRKAAREFEGMLLASLLQSWQHIGPFSEEDEQSAGQDTLESVGIQATANALASRGALGIAEMVERCLNKASPPEVSRVTLRQVWPEPPRAHPPSD